MRFTVIVDVNSLDGHFYDIDLTMYRVYKLNCLIFKPFAVKIGTAAA